MKYISFGTVISPDVDSLAVERHQDGPVAVGATLVQAAAARRRGDFAEIGQFHLASDRHLQVVDAVERAGNENASRRAGREPLLHRNVGEVVVDFEAADPVVGEDLVRDAGGITEEAAF